MAIGSFDKQRQQGPMAEMNIVPLVDVMLVLVVIFIVTAPLLTHAVKVDLPKASSEPNLTQPDHIELAIRQDGSLLWDGAPVTLEELGPRFAAQAAHQPQPELHIHADRLAYYDSVAKVMAAAAKAGLGRIGFVTEPEERQRVPGTRGNP
jgi:biopolymer transport protein ExbD